MNGSCIYTVINKSRPDQITFIFDISLDASVATYRINTILSVLKLMHFRAHLWEYLVHQQTDIDCILNVKVKA